MKTVLLLLFASATIAFGEPTEITLEPDKDDNKDYGKQLIEKFAALLESDKGLMTQFDEFEAAPKERAGGRYMGPRVRSLLLHQSLDVDPGDSPDTRDYTQTVVLYYSFAEGFRKGMEETSGVFAIFHIIGHESYVRKRTAHWSS